MILSNSGCEGWLAISGKRNYVEFGLFAMKCEEFVIECFTHVLAIGQVCFGAEIFVESAFAIKTIKRAQFAVVG